MDLEQLQKKWKKLDVKPAPLQKSGRHYRRLHYHTGVQGLNTRLYRRMLLSSVYCALAPALLIPFCHIIKVSEITIILYIIFFLIMCCAYAYIAHLLGDPSYLSLPLVQAIKQVGKREICMRRIKIASRFLAIPVLVFLFIDIYDDSVLHGEGGLIGGITGGVAGLICGLRIELSNRRIIRKIKSHLQDMEPDNL